MTKIRSLEELEKFANSTSDVGFVMCFGHFNTIHPGHIRHFRNGRHHAGHLVVAVEGDAQMLEIEQSHIFSERERANAVAAVDLVDFVVILSDFSLRELVSRVQPSVLMLGKEFERDNVRNMASVVAALESYGGRVVYDAGETHYSTSHVFHHSLNELEGHFQIFQVIRHFHWLVGIKHVSHIFARKFFKPRNFRRTHLVIIVKSLTKPRNPR